jgi:MerR family transcriptional regulator, light-induced transcriptional regulator
MPSSKILADVLNQWGSCPELDDGYAARRSSGLSRSREAFSRSGLAQVIESAVIPRLMVAHRSEILGKSRVEAGVQHIDKEDVVELTRLVLQHDADVALEYTRAHVNRGVAVEEIYMGLLAPSAHLLGEMWKSDHCDFTDVTIGLSRLQHVLHELSPAFNNEDVTSMANQRVLLLPVPEEQHTFGVRMVEEFFRRAGWDCCSAIPRKLSDIVATVSKSNFDVVGISLSGDHLLDRLPEVTAAVRKHSANKNIKVLVGGRVFTEEPALADRIGADGTARDGRHAVLQLRSLFYKRV